MYKKNARGAYALEIKGLKKTYSHGVEALKGIDLQVKKGDFFALLGANGAGKSTTIGILSTLIKKSSGHINIYGHDLDHESDIAKACLGLVPQEMNLNVFETCENILICQAGFYGISRAKAQKRAHQLLKQVGLWDKRTHIVRNLSGGMKRRLMIARALTHHPQLLILDEPTAGVDLEIRRNIWRFLKEINAQGTTIILTTHYLEEAEQLCNHMAIIDQGRIIENTSMSTLFNTAHDQTLILTTFEPLKTLPDMSPYITTQLDQHTFELRVDTQYTINHIFDVLNRLGVHIQNIRNKTNRLEELFLDKIHRDE